MKKFLIILIIALISVQFADAQRKKSSMFDDTPSDRGWNEGDLYIGPHLGLGWGAAIGVDGEYAITDKKWVAIGVGGNLAYHTGLSYSWYSETMISASVYASYHLFPHKKFDVYAKLGLGYRHYSYTYNDPLWDRYYSTPSNASIGEIFEAGLRYYFTPAIAFRAFAGSPVYLGVGLDFKLM